MARDRSRVFAARANEPNSATRVKTRMPCSWSMGEYSMADCQAGPDNEFGFVRFFEPVPSGKLQPNCWSKIHVRLRPFSPCRPRTTGPAPGRSDLFPSLSRSPAAGGGACGAAGSDRRRQFTFEVSGQLGDGGEIEQFGEVHEARIAAVDLLVDLDELQRARADLEQVVVHVDIAFQRRVANVLDLSFDLGARQLHAASGFGRSA